MKDRFFITGLPRSRTAWFAVACCVAGRHCVHEPLGVDSFLDNLGISDSGMGLSIEFILNQYGPRTLIIERSLEGVVESLTAYFGGHLPIPHEAGERRLAALQEALQYQHPLIKRVAYADLHSTKVLESCFEWLKVPIPPGLEQLKHMNIQSDLGYNLAKLRALAA